MRYNALPFAAVSCAVLCVSLSRPASADVTLPRLLTDGCVLQHGTAVRIYGRADAGEKVTVSLGGQKTTVMPGTNGAWEAKLKPLKAGGPYTLVVQGKNTLTVRNVLAGEVWVCSGQSNMEWPLNNTEGGKEEIARSSDPQLRMFTVTKATAAEPQPEVAGGNWLSASPQTSAGFSAVGYYFAKALRASRKVPIGVIHTSWGGTRIEAWMSKPVLLSHGVAAAEFAPTDPNSPAYIARKASHDALVARWKAAGSPQGAFADPGRGANTAGWEAPEMDDSGWGVATLPGLWDANAAGELAGMDGGVWYRRVVNVPADLAQKSCVLTLGAIDDLDTTFVNGVRVGGIGAETAEYWSVQRRYTVPVGVLKPGKNVVAVRAWDMTGGGGFSGPADALRLAPVDDPRAGVALAGEWRYKAETVRPSDPGAFSAARNPNAAATLYNAMLVPVTPYTIRGALWYQGESNAGAPDRYRELHPAMIQNWRQDFGVGNFPFLLVQLAPFMAINAEPVDTSWARLREAQYLTTKALPNVGMAVITDVGDEKDIHPRKKAPVGARLALLARKIAYGEKIVAQGPTYRSMKVEEGKVTLTFENAGTGLVAQETDTAGKPVPKDKLVGFAIAGRDGKFVWADARISGRDTIEVTSPLVPFPTMVRFGWADYPVVNLWNAEGLPAIPFRTDVQPK